MEQTLADWQLGNGTLSVEDLINVPYGKKPDLAKLAAKYDGEPISMTLDIFARDQARVRCLVDYSVKEIEAKAAKGFPCNVV